MVYDGSSNSNNEVTEKTTEGEELEVEADENLDAKVRCNFDLVKFFLSLKLARIK